ncbi:MAG: hypothetical protein WBG19_09705 [Thermoplasmata archaeon]
MEVEEIQPHPRLVAPPRPQFTDSPTAPARTTSSNKYSVDYSAIVAVIRAISAILAVRLFLLLSVIGSFVLAYLAMLDTTTHSIWVLVAYCVLTVLPLVFLSFKDTVKAKEDARAE